MPETKILQVRNRTSERLLFVKLEDTRNNRYCEPNSLTDVDSCTVPWVDDNDGFRRKSIAITSLSTARVVGYIYQHKNDGDGDHIRITTSGYQSSGSMIAGDSEAGGERDLEIDLSNGNYTVTAVKVDRT